MVEQDVVALRKAAVLAHWVPGVNLTVTGSDGTTMLVTAEDTLRDVTVETGWSVDERSERCHPCVFRSHLIQVDQRWLERLGALHIGIVTSPSTSYDDNGLLVVAIDDHHELVCFAALAEADHLGQRVVDPAGHDCQWPVNDVPIVHQLDPDLGIVLVHCGYPAGDVLRARVAYEAVFEALLAYSVEEVTLAASRAG